MNLFSIDPGLAIWTWIAFLSLFFVLSRYAFPPLLASLKERENMIARSVDDAQAIKEKLARANKDCEKLLHEARDKGDTLIRQAREEAEAVRHELLRKAEVEAENIVKQAHRQIAEDRQAATQALLADLAVFVCDTSEQVVGKSFTGEQEQNWVRELAEQL